MGLFRISAGKLKRQLEVGGPKNVVKDTEDLITEDLKALSFADKYWRDYLKDVATQNMMDKLVSPED